MPVASRAALSASRRYRLHPTFHLEDLVQYGLLGAIEAADRWDGRGVLEGYAYMRIRGAILDGVREEMGSRRLGHIPFPIDDFAAFGLEPTLHDDGYGEVEARDLLEHVLSIVRDARNSRNPERDADMFARHINGENLADIGDDYGLSESRICQIMSRLRRRIADQLEVAQ